MKNNEGFYLDDNSGDKKYFTIIPNYIANHSTAIDQALYFQMKRFAGEHGVCWASKRTLMKQMSVGIKSLNKSIDYLVSHGWISFVGKKTIMTKGGIQEVDTYSVNDIWKKNNEHFEQKQGVAESTYLAQGVAESKQEVLLKDAQGVAKSTPKKNHINNIHNEEDLTDSFNQFWDIYPNRKGKPKALISWKKLKPNKDLVDLVILGVNKYINSEQWRETRYIPHPATFLNQRRWEDEIEEVAPQKVYNFND